ncbi:MAG TPA: VPDSG-CTERM sorting domain-containing protein [Opitutaceae bacterium]|nr:VPDSG-CTERM sorting domain-containing protein [Opitutaceae bacterium]
MKPVLLAGFALMAGFAALPAHAVTIMTQTFTDSWSIEPYSYSNQTSAWEWSYTPYTTWDSSLGTLTQVKVHTTVLGTRNDASESLFLRSSFFTGWNPDQFQHYMSESVAPGQADFSFNFSKSYSGAGLDAWVNPMYLPQAHYYFESRTYGAGHTITNAVTTLEYIYEPNPTATVPDSGSTAVILGGALVGMVVWKRRRNAARD